MVVIAHNLFRYTDFFMEMHFKRWKQGEIDNYKVQVW